MATVQTTQSIACSMFLIYIISGGLKSSTLIDLTTLQAILATAKALMKIFCKCHILPMCRREVYYLENQLFSLLFKKNFHEHVLRDSQSTYYSLCSNISVQKMVRIYNVLTPTSHPSNSWILTSHSKATRQNHLFPEKLF